MWKRILERCRAQMTIWCTNIADCIPGATNTHTDRVILIAFPQQQRLHERAPVLRYTYVACLNCILGLNCLLGLHFVTKFFRLHPAELLFKFIVLLHASYQDSTMSATDEQIWNTGGMIPKKLVQARRAPGKLSRYNTTLRARRSRDRILVGARFSAPVHTGSEAHPASYTIVPVLSRG